MTELDLITTDNLIAELANRHDELIIIRNTQDKTVRDAERIFIKTRPPISGRRYNVVDATEMLTSAQDFIVRSCFEEGEEDDAI